MLLSLCHVILYPRKQKTTCFELVGNSLNSYLTKFLLTKSLYLFLTSMSYWRVIEISLSVLKIPELSKLINNNVVGKLKVSKIDFNKMERNEEIIYNEIGQKKFHHIVVDFWRAETPRSSISHGLMSKQSPNLPIW